jgi:hypothetical protein
LENAVYVLNKDRLENEPKISCQELQILINKFLIQRILSSYPELSQSKITVFQLDYYRTYWGSFKGQSSLGDKFDMLLEFSCEVPNFWNFIRKHKVYTTKTLCFGGHDKGLHFFQNGINYGGYRATI